MASTVPAQKEDRSVFAAGSKSFSVRDVIDAAHFRGEVIGPWRETLARVAATTKAEETGAELDDAAVDAAAVEFRYRYDLITAEETERWLELHGLTLVEFSDYFAREHWGKSFRQKSEPAPFEEAPLEMRELLAIDLTLNGALDAMSQRLAWRVAAAEAAGGSEPATEKLEAERQRFLEQSGLDSAGVSKFLERLGRDESWLEEMLALEARFRSDREKILTADAAEREMGALRLPLTRFEVETIEFESRDAACEAVLCVRDDGLSMAQVAAEGRYPYRRGELLLENIPDELQQKFLSLTPGSMLEPIAVEDGFQLSRLLGKAEPAASDPAVRARIEERILERHFAELTAKQIRWEIMPGGAE